LTGCTDSSSTSTESSSSTEATGATSDTSTENPTTGSSGSSDSDASSDVTSVTETTEGLSETTEGLSETTEGLSETTEGTTETTSETTSETTEATTDDPSTTGDPPVIEVLFIGNSYTAGNDLAGLVQAMGEADPEAPELVIEAIAIGGETMAGHLSTASTITTIEEGVWDFVVLQGQSVEPLFPNSGFTEAGIELAGVVKDAGATPLLFETWARKAGSELYEEPWYGATPEEAQAGLRAAYQEVADASGGAMAPVGDAWEIIWTEEPMIDLYAGDGSHAQLTGTYLAASVFFEAITQVSPVGNMGIPDGVDPETAMILQEAADEVVP